MFAIEVSSGGLSAENGNLVEIITICPVIPQVPYWMTGGDLLPVELFDQGFHMHHSRGRQSAGALA